MGQPVRTPKGEISITNFEGRIRLRWRLNGKRYSLNLPYSYSSENMHYATVKVAEIKLDIIRDKFDESLETYKPDIIRPSIQPAKKNVESKQIWYLNDLIEKFNEWAAHIKNIDINNSFDYLYTRKLLEKWINVPIGSITEKIGFERWAVTTYNRRLTCLRNFFTWLQDSKIISFNPLLHVTKRREKGKVKNERRKPLSEAEIATFLNAIKNDTYCPTSSRFKHSHYYNFLFFIFHTGVRNAEAIGLRVKHVDFYNNRIEVSETFARTVKGTNHAARISKDTKTGNVRYLPLSNALNDILQFHTLHKSIDSFVFLSPKGLSIDDRMLKRRILKPVMIALGLGDRDLYAARHSFGTRAVQQGMAITDVAYLMGHSTVEMTIRNYVSVERRTIQLPTMKH
jgi:integrase